MRAVVLLAALLLPAFCFADDLTYGNVQNVEITSIYDGDTFRVNIASWPPVIGYDVPIRVRGIDTPEIRGLCEKEKELAVKAREAARTFLLEADQVNLVSLERGMYFRIVASVEADNVTLDDHLIDQGLAVRYDGGTKNKDWCE